MGSWSVLVQWTSDSESTWGLHDANCWSWVSTWSFLMTWNSLVLTPVALHGAVRVLCSDEDPQSLAPFSSSGFLQPRGLHKYLLSEWRALIPAADDLTSQRNILYRKCLREEPNFGSYTLIGLFWSFLLKRASVSSSCLAGRIQRGKHRDKKPCSAHDWHSC